MNTRSKKSRNPHNQNYIQTADCSTCEEEMLNRTLKVRNISLNICLMCKIWYFDMELAHLRDSLMLQLPTLAVWLLTDCIESWVFSPIVAPATDLLLVILLICSHSFSTADLF